MSFPIINDEQIKSIKPNSNATINEKRTETINQLTKACFGYFGTAPENINEQWESNCFLLDGKWGSGKSWTLDVIEAWIKKDEFKIEIEIKENVQFLKFSAWQYLKEEELFYDIWKQLNWNLLKNIASKFEKSPDDIQSLKDLYSSGRILGNLGLSFVNKFIHTAGFKLPEIKEKTREQAIDGLLRYDDRMKQLKIDLPTIVVIDDLDRVHEDKLWRILTLLSLFDKQANLVFICVGSSEYLIKILDAKYHVKHEGENFLTKFFAREFQLKQDSYLELLVNEFVPETEWAEVLEFLNLFVDIPTYREYKTRYLQPLMEMKEDTTKNVNSVEFIITQFLQIKYANILHLLKSKNYSDLKSEIEKIIDSKNEKVQNLGLLMTAILIGMNTSIMISYTGWKGNKPKELQTSSSTVHNINIGLKKHAIDDGYILEFLYSMNFRRINYDLNFKFLEFLHS